MPIFFSLKDEIDWETLAPDRPTLRKVLRSAGTKLASVLRDRYRARGKLVDKIGRFSRQTKASPENAAKTKAELKKQIGRDKTLRSSGQLAKSIKARLRRSEDVVVIGFSGIRKDADTHKKRKPLSNFTLAAMHAARGNDMLGLSEDDEANFLKDVEERIFAAIQKEVIPDGAEE